MERFHLLKKIKLIQNDIAELNTIQLIFIIRFRKLN